MFACKGHHPVLGIDGKGSKGLILEIDQVLQFFL
jgi:hypothetical protein